MVERYSLFLLRERVIVGTRERHEENPDKLRQGFYGLMTFGLHERAFPAGPEELGIGSNVDGGRYVSLCDGLFKAVSDAIFPA
jgi:hypothetical protein